MNEYTMFDYAILYGHWAEICVINETAVREGGRVYDTFGGYQEYSSNFELMDDESRRYHAE